MSLPVVEKVVNQDIAVLILISANYSKKAVAAAMGVSLHKSLSRALPLQGF